MEVSLDFNQLVVQPLVEMVKGIVAYIPNIISSLLIIILGVLLAVIAKYLVTIFLRSVGFDSFSQKIGLVTEQREEGASETAPHQYGAAIVYWIIVLTAVIFALRNLRLRGASYEVDAVFSYALTIITVAVLAVVGLVLSMLVYRIVKRTAEGVGHARPELLASVGKWMVLTFVFLVCLFRIGLPENLLIGFLTITYGTLCITFVISFGIGGARFASEVLAKLLKSTEERK